MSGSITNGGTIGSGSDSIALNVSEDQALGTDAQFTVNVDGQQIGGLQTATAQQLSGQQEAFTFLGNFGIGPHTVSVTFTNNFQYPGTSGDRNLYVDNVNYDGKTVSDATTPIYQSPLFPPNSTDGDVYGNAVYTVNDTTPVLAGAASTPTTTPAAVSVGSGADTLVLNMAEDYYQGDAQFTVSVDGQQIGGTQTVTASVAQGQFQEFDVHGNFGSGTHTVTADFTNNAGGAFYPGTTDTIDTEDRNLYVMGASLDGGPAASGAPWEQASDGSESFTVTAGSNASATAFSSGLFANDGAAATSDNAAISAGSLSAGSTTSGGSSGISFIASSTNTGTAASTSGSTSSASPTSSGDTSNASGSTGSTIADTTPSVASTVAGTTQTVSDVTPPAATSTSDTSSNSSTSAGSGHWWMNQQTSSGYVYHHQHG